MRKLPKVLSPDEQRRLLATFNVRYATPRRNRALVALALATGLRASELTHLRPEHVELDTGRLIVREGKGAKDRVVWAPDHVVDELLAWLAIRPAGSPWFFCARGGDRLATTYLRRMVKRAARLAHVAEADKVSPHTLRHTFATDLYKRTRDIRLTQKALGHSSITTTMIYTHLVDDDLQAAMRGA